MKHTAIIATALAASIFAATALAADADPRQARGAPADEQAGLEEGADKASGKAGCVRKTGTRLPRQDTCLPGRAYDQDDIRRTGATNVAEALQMLDPSISVRRY